MNQDSRKSLTAILILFFSIILAFIAIRMPVQFSVERLIFVEDAFWAISWLVIARTSFLARRSGFPPLAISATIAVELYLFIHYSFIDPWPYNPWLLVNYFLWPLTSVFNFMGVLLFSSDELVRDGDRKKAGIRLTIEVAAFFILFWFIAGRLPNYLVMVYLGQSVIGYISLHFLILLLRRDDFAGLSYGGNILRILAGFMCYYANAIVREQELSSLPFLSILMISIVLIDLSFITIFTWKKWAIRKAG